MSRIFVDGSNQNESDISFAYENKNTEIEEVVIYDDAVVEIRIDEDTVSVYTQDIHKLIKALKAAYKHIEGKEIDE